MTEGTLDSLSDAELQAVASVVDALVRRDTDALAAAGAYDFGADRYMYVDDYYRSGAWTSSVRRVLPGVGSAM